MGPESSNPFLEQIESINTTPEQTESLLSPELQDITDKLSNDGYEWDSIAGTEIDLKNFQTTYNKLPSEKQEFISRVFGEVDFMDLYEYIETNGIIVKDSLFNAFAENFSNYLPEGGFKKEKAVERKEAVVERKEAAVERKEVVDQNQEAVDQNQEAVDQNQEAVDQNQEAVDQNQEAVVESNKEKRARANEFVSTMQGGIPEKITGNIGKNIRELISAINSDDEGEISRLEALVKTELTKEGVLEQVLNELSTDKGSYESFKSYARSIDSSFEDRVIAYEALKDEEKTNVFEEVGRTDQVLLGGSADRSIGGIKEKDVDSGGMIRLDTSKNPPIRSVKNGEYELLASAPIGNLYTVESTFGVEFERSQEKLLPENTKLNNALHFMNTQEFIDADLRVAQKRLGIILGSDLSNELGVSFASSKDVLSNKKYTIADKIESNKNELSHLESEYRNALQSEIADYEQSLREKDQRKLKIVEILNTTLQGSVSLSNLERIFDQLNNSSISIDLGGVIITGFNIETFEFKGSGIPVGLHENLNNKQNNRMFSRLMNVLLSGNVEHPIDLSTLNSGNPVFRNEAGENISASFADNMRGKLTSNPYGVMLEHMQNPTSIE